MTVSHILIMKINHMLMTATLDAPHLSIIIMNNMLMSSYFAMVSCESSIYINTNDEQYVNNITICRDY